MKGKILIISFGLFLIALPIFGRDTESARITYLEGVAKLNSQPARINDAISEGDELSTEKGRVEVEINGNYIRLNHYSQVFFAAFQKEPILLDVRYGEVYIQAEDMIDIQTPHETFSIEGLYRIEVSRYGTKKFSKPMLEDDFDKWEYRRERELSSAYESPYNRPYYYGWYPYWYYWPSITWVDWYVGWYPRWFYWRFSSSWYWYDFYFGWYPWYWNWYPSWYYFGFYPYYYGYYPYYYRYYRHYYWYDPPKRGLTVIRRDQLKRSTPGRTGVESLKPRKTATSKQLTQPNAGIKSPAKRVSTAKIYPSRITTSRVTTRQTTNRVLRRNSSVSFSPITVSQKSFVVRSSSLSNLTRSPRITSGTSFRYPRSSFSGSLRSFSSPSLSRPSIGSFSRPSTGSFSGSVSRPSVRSSPSMGSIRRR